MEVLWKKPPAKTLTDVEIEPVAWMLVTGHGTKILEKKPYCQVDYWKPLYTHPAKTLTDEEIWAIANDYFVGKSDYVYGFARAILRKASE